MVTAVQHLRHTLGIDLASVALDVRNPRYLQPGDGAWKEQITDDRSPARYLEAIYDAVVGFNDSNGTRFDMDDGQARITIPQLRRLAVIADEMRAAPELTDAQKKVLDHVVRASTTYLDFLLGRRGLVKKDSDKLGNRHTLMRGANGRVFEMMNSMTANEMERFRTRTGVDLEMVEKAPRGKPRNGKEYFRVELGQGAFGRVRMARDIGTDAYLAVKKRHPDLIATVEDGPIPRNQQRSNYFFLSNTRQRALQQAGEFIIAPSDVAEHPGRKSGQIAHLSRALRASAITPGAFEAAAENMGELRSAIEALPADERVAFFAKLAQGSFPTRAYAPKTGYEFSELGVSTVDDLINKFNVLRCWLECRQSADELPGAARRLLVRYARAYREPSAHATATTAAAATTATAATAERTRDHTRQAIAEFESDEFKLKDPVYNRRFLNTLGKKMLCALAKLHSIGLAHFDIKPENILICQDGHGQVTVKLIDLDLVEPLSDEPGLPGKGTSRYMPPEALVPEADGSVSCLGKKSDAYAMGMSLRRLLGYSDKEITGLNSMHVVAGMSPAVRTLVEATLAPDEMPRPYLEQAENILNSIELPDDVKPQEQLHVAAIMKAAPDAVGLKDISDLMLKTHPGKRLTPEEVLECAFFNHEENLLPDAAFSEHASRIGRLGMLIEQDEIHMLNNDGDAARGRLAQLRRSANQALIRSRGERPDPASNATLSAAEMRRVSKAEKGIQLRAVGRRMIRSMKSPSQPGMTIAERKLQYPKR